LIVNRKLISPQTHFKYEQTALSRHIRSAMREGVYVLALQKGGVYVGKSRDIDARVQQHCNGVGSNWCRHQGGVIAERAPVVAGSLLDAASWEMNETVAQMLIHGYENVRGWEFSSCGPLTSRECDTIKTIVMGQGNMCRRCGGEGHFATNCTHALQPWLLELERLQVKAASPSPPARNAMACATMAYPSKPVEASAAELAAGPAPAAMAAVKPAAERVASTGVSQARASGRGGSALCLRCGRDSHRADTCFAHTHFTGAPIKARSPPAQVRV
jgi:hypothetical protein